MGIAIQATRMISNYTDVDFFRKLLHFLLQYLTDSQFFSHFFRHVNGLWHWIQTF